MAVLPIIRLWAFSILIVPEYPARIGVMSAISFGLSKRRPFSSAKMQASAKYFFPRRLIAGDDGVVKLLCAMDQFVLRDRNIGGAGDGYAGEKCNEREFHNTSLFLLHTSAFSLTRSLQLTTRPCVSGVRC